MKIFYNRYIIIFFVILLTINAGFAEELKVGDKAPDFIIENFNGKKFSSSALKSKKVLLLWFSNLCKGCQAYFPKMENIKKLYEKKGVEFLVISVLLNDRKTAEKIIQDTKTTLNFYYDPKGEITKLFCKNYNFNYVKACPLTNIFIIGKEGKILYIEHYPSDLEDEIIEYLNKAIKSQIK
ncbi:MAG: redoxin domain-containing protein [Armatimonadetes bacterium]|nr:redoxin domain-containing protein [Armatimonadota bacterium]